MGRTPGQQEARVATALWRASRPEPCRGSLYTSQQSSSAPSAPLPMGGCWTGEVLEASLLPGQQQQQQLRRRRVSR